MLSHKRFLNNCLFPSLIKLLILSKNFNQEKEFFELRVKHQQFVQDNLLEEFVKAYMHPNRIKKLLDMGYSINDLDNIL